MSEPKRQPIVTKVTPTEAVAAYVALSGHTPWTQFRGAQRRASVKLRDALAEHGIVRRDGTLDAKGLRRPVVLSLSLFEANAAFIAFSNFTPPPRTHWRQSAQTRAVRKLQRAMWRMEREAKKASARRNGRPA